MSLIILQITIKQWDKSQRTAAYVLQRANIPEAYPLIFPQAFYVFNKQCVIDQQGDDIQGNRIKYAQDSDGNIYFDRFRIGKENNVIAYHSMFKFSAITGLKNSQFYQLNFVNH